MHDHLLGGSEADLPVGWEKSLRKVVDPSSKEIRYVPSRRCYFVMMALCFINTFSGTFLVPHCKHLAEFFHRGPIYAALVVCAPYITNIGAVYLSKYLIAKKGWLVASLVNCGFMMLGTGFSFCTLYFEPLQNPFLLLVGGLFYGMGMGQQYIGRQLGVETSSASARNKIFAQQTTATSLGILAGTSTSGLTSLVRVDGNMTSATLALPFAVLCGLASLLFVAMTFFLPNKIVAVPKGETLSTLMVNLEKKTSIVMEDSEKKLRIWSTLIIGFNRVVVRSMVENETTAFYQKRYGYPEIMSSSCLALAYLTGIIGLSLFGVVHDRLTDRTWVFITLALIFSGTLLAVPVCEDWKLFETVKFTLGLCIVLPGLAMNTAVANSTATKYAIPSHWLYTNEMIGLLQIVTQTSLARIVGPFLGYVLAVQSMTTTIILQALLTILSWYLVYIGVQSNIAETAKGRANLKISC